MVKSSPACPGDRTRHRGRSQWSGSAPSRGARGARVPAHPGRPSTPPSFPPAAGAWGGLRSRWPVGASHFGRGAVAPQVCGSLMLRTWLCWGCASSQERVSRGSSQGRPASSAWRTQGRSVGSPCPQTSPARGSPAPAARKSNTTAARRCQGVGAGRARVRARACPPRRLQMKPECLR